MALRLLSEGSGLVGRRCLSAGGDPTPHRPDLRSQEGGWGRMYRQGTELLRRSREGRGAGTSWATRLADDPYHHGGAYAGPGTPGLSTDFREVFSGTVSSSSPWTVAERARRSSASGGR